MEKRSALRRFTDKLYGGINLTWPGIILYAVGTAVLTTVFLVLPIFHGTSFVRMGETLEAWIFFAVIIIANAKSPLDSALKTFVFFLISQPLIYLFQVPFSWQGWGLFQYYKYWFILTLCTFPAAYIGWYIKKKNWLSLLILMPVLILLAYLCEDGLKHVIHQFPSLLIMVVFCVLQVFLYPRWLFLLHYTGTIYTTMTFVFAMVFILPWNPEFAVSGTQLYLHVICPIAILVSFELVESGYQITKRNTLACLIPFLIYSLVYVVNVVLLGETNGGWEDLYMLNTFVPFYFSLPAVWLLAYVIATLIRILSNRLDILRRNHLLSFWKEDADPIELNIEIYGLGRYNGMHDTRNELSIPYDLLELFAERYSRDPDDLLKIYMKGMMDALKMH